MTAKPELQIPLGVDVATGEAVSVPISTLHRGGYFTGQSGQGKSSTILRLLVEVIRRGSPAIVIDDAGETFTQLERFAAFYGWHFDAAMRRAKVPDKTRRDALRKRVFRRYTFGFVGFGRENEVRIDLLRRRQLPTRIEAIEEVVIGTLKPFEARFADIAIRTRFLAVVEPLLTALVAAQRPITESHALLLDPEYWPFLLREIERLKTLEEQVSADFVLPRLQELRRILDLRKNREGSELEPYPQRFYDRVESTLNALHMYRPGTVTGRFFDSDSFAPEAVVFHDRVFAATSNISDELIRNQTTATIYTFFERLMKYRVPGMGVDRFRLYLALDEIRWFFETLTRFLSVARNHRVSTFILNQQDEQWEQLGMPALARVVPSLLRFRVQYRAATKAAADEMAMLGGKYDPFGMQRREHTITHTTSHSSGTSSVEGDSDTDSDGYTELVGSGGRRAIAGENIGSEDETWNRGHNRQTGSSRTNSSSFAVNESDSESQSLVEHILSASVADQHFLRTQDMRTLAEHTALVTAGDEHRIIRMQPFAPFPTEEDGKDILAWFRAEANAHLAAAAQKRPAYSRAISLREFVLRSQVLPTPKQQPAAGTAVKKGKPVPDGALRPSGKKKGLDER